MMGSDGVHGGAEGDQQLSSLSAAASIGCRQQWFRFKGHGNGQPGCCSHILPFVIIVLWRLSGRSRVQFRWRGQCTASSAPSTAPSRKSTCSRCGTRTSVNENTFGILVTASCRVYRFAWACGMSC